MGSTTIRAEGTARASRFKGTRFHGSAVVAAAGPEGTARNRSTTGGLAKTGAGVSSSAIGSLAPMQNFGPEALGTGASGTGNSIRVSGLADGLAGREGAGGRPFRWPAAAISASGA